MNRRIVCVAVTVLTVTLVLGSSSAKAQVAPPATAPAAAPDAEFVKKLQGPVTVEFIANKLDPVLTFFHHVSGLPVEAQWARLKEIEITPDSTVSLRLNAKPMGRAIELSVSTVSHGRAVAYVHDGEVRVTTAKHHRLLLDVHGPGVARLKDVLEPADAEVIAAVGKKLETPTKVNLEAVELRDAIKFVCDLTGADVVVDAATLAEAETSLDAEVSLEVAGVAAGQVALAVVRAAGADDAELTIDPWGVVLIASPERLKALMPTPAKEAAAADVE